MLRLRIAREVGNVQSQRGPVTDHGCERWKEETQKTPCRMKLTRLREHGTEAAGLHQCKDEQRYGHHKHEWRRKSLQKADALYTLPDHCHVQRPEAEEARPHRPRR